MTKPSMITAVLAAVTFAGPALAHGKGGDQYHGLGRDHMIKEYDKDGNGRLSRAERTAAAQAIFKAADRDGSGGLSMAEWEAYREKRLTARRQAVHARIDADGDGAISADEFTAGHRRFHRRFHD
ncbi:MAG: hypothetical protein ACPGVX_07150 [Thalassobaculaceae bacterium]